MKKLYESLDVAESQLKELFGSGKTFDVVIQKIYVKNLPVLTVYISGLVNGTTYAEMLSKIPFEYNEKN